MKTNEVFTEREFLSLYKRADTTDRIVISSLLCVFSRENRTSEAMKEEETAIFSKFFKCEVETAIEALKSFLQNDCEEWRRYGGKCLEVLTEAAERL